eukprot:TRINITY_DN67403_c3_g7_i1.p1 TRINITY_DN67403_c3_g7~~TRINITY_DN67403_c3_g7_i1.p1  ORF type:complete len:662 (-),score=90.79 TRINITY_DN67403_c3_g7_i1:174-2159(-)
MTHPPPPFKWPKSADEIKQKVTDILDQTTKLYDKIAALKEEELSFDTVIQPLMQPPNYKTNPALCEAKFMQHCHTDAEIRDAANTAGSTFGKERVTFRMRDDVFKVVEAYSKTEEAQKLDDTKAYYLQAVIKDFKRTGLGLSAEKRAEFKKLLDEDTAICAEFSANIGKDTTALFFEKKELEGLPEEFIKERTQEDGKVKITLKYPDIVPISGNCEVPETRKKVVLARERDAYGNNLELVAKAVKIRKQMAQLLGFEHYADYILQNRMAADAKTVTKFLSELREKLVAPAKEEYAKLLSLKKEFCASKGIEFDDKINAWDMGFYSNLLLKKEYGVDDEVVKEYFPLDVVVKETMLIYQEVLSLKFTEIKEFDSWHPEVRCFIVHDQESNTKIGHFYLDLHPRAGKYGHAAIFHLLKKCKQTEFASAACMLANLPAPGADGKPALLRHDDVVTFFHEFGHIMHDICSEGDCNMTILAKCPRDFVEAPSQMLENWCWTPEVLARLSSHYETGKPLPDDLLQNMLRAKNVGFGLFNLRQIYLATLDMTIHTDPPDDLLALCDKLRPEISMIENPTGCSILKNFGHLMNQYAAAYYGYLWAEVLSADMFFVRFDKEGVFNSKTGMDYRKKVLAPGGVGSILEHVTNFLGRPPQQENFLRSKGIVP